MRGMTEPSFGTGRSARRLLADIDTAGAAQADKLTAHLKDHARSYGWNENAVKHLRVRYADGGYHPDFAPEGRVEVEKHEYGNLDRRPRPALRTWAMNSHTYASGLHDQALNAVLLNELF